MNQLQLFYKIGQVAKVRATVISEVRGEQRTTYARLRQGDLTQ
jgi:hypothetical protein